MSLSVYLSTKKSQLESFLYDPAKSTLYLASHSEDQDSILQLLASLQGEDGKEHLLLGLNPAFAPSATFWARWASLIDSQLRQHYQATGLGAFASETLPQKQVRSPEEFAEFLNGWQQVFHHHFDHLILLYWRRTPWETLAFHQSISQLTRQLGLNVKLVLLGPSICPQAGLWLAHDNAQKMDFSIHGQAIKRALLELANHHENPSIERVRCLNLAASLALSKGNMVTARTQAIEAYSYCHELKSAQEAAMASLIIGRVAAKQEDWLTSRLWLERAISLVSESESPYMLSACYLELGETYQKEGNYHRAIQYFQNSQKWAQLTKNRIEEAIALEHLGFSLCSLGEFQSAQSAFREAMVAYEELEERIPPQIIQSRNRDRLDFMLNGD